jgi:hypothetical protein
MRRERLELEEDSNMRRCSWGLVVFVMASVPIHVQSCSLGCVRHQNICDIEPAAAGILLGK